MQNRAECKFFSVKVIFLVAKRTLKKTQVSDLLYILFNMKNSQASMTFILITILLDAIGVGLVIPILPEVIARFGTDPTFISNYYGYFISVYSLMLFIASPLLGSLADRYGRRPILLIALCGSGLDYLLMAFAPTLTILFIGRIISGLTGASITAASSYIADVSTDENRTTNFGLFGAAFGIGFVVGPALGGVLGSYGHNLPFILSAVLSLANFIFGLFILPESLPPEKRKSKISLSALNPVKSIGKIVFNSPVVILIWVYFFIHLAGQSHPSVWALYTHYKFQWTTLEIGLSLTAVGLAFGIGQGYTTRLVIPKLGEMKSVICGTIVLIFNYLFFALATNSVLIYMTISLLIFTGIVMPSLQSMITKSTPPEQQGELQGTLVSIMSLTSIIGPLIYTGLFTYFTAKGHYTFPEAPYYLAAIIAAICLILVLKEHKARKMM